MRSIWGIILLAGLAFSAADAWDTQVIADDVVTSMNAALAAHASQWFSLPGFNISFNNGNESRWHVQQGELTSVGGLDRNGDPIITFNTHSSFLNIPISIKNLVATYKFSCEDFFVMSGASYSISKTIANTEGVVEIEIVNDGNSTCLGNVADVQYSYEFPTDGSDMSAITPSDYYAKQCIIRSYTSAEQYLDPINQHFFEDYRDALNNFLTAAAEFTLKNLNPCWQE